MLPGICQSPKWADIIVVSLPASAGRITPPHTASSNSVIFSYEPVVPVIEVDSALSNDTQVVMLVSLDYPSTLEVRCAEWWSLGVCVADCVFISTQTRSFSISMATLLYSARVRPVVSLTDRSEASTNAQHWELIIDMVGFQSYTDIAVELPPSAPGFDPPNAPSNRVVYEFSPSTALSARSVLSCTSNLVPASSIRRNGQALCTVQLLDGFGDPVKGVLSQFRVLTGPATASAVRPAQGGYAGFFTVTPPPVGDTLSVEVTLAATGKHVVGSPVVLDIADIPSTQSSLACATAEADLVEYGTQDMRCVISVSGPSGPAKGIVSDFTVTAQVEGSGFRVDVPSSALVAVTGGTALEFGVDVQAVDHDQVFQTLVIEASVVVGDSVMSLDGGPLVLTITEKPDPVLSAVDCQRKQAFDPLETLESGRTFSHPVVYTALNEVVRCTIRGYAGTEDNPRAVPTLASRFQVAATAGIVSDIFSLANGATHVVWFVAPSVGTSVWLTVSTTSEALAEGVVGGSPWEVRLSQHDFNLPYMRCDSRRYPETTIFGQTTHCYVHGMPTSAPADFAASVVSGSGWVSELSPMVPGLTSPYNFLYTPHPNAHNSSSVLAVTGSVDASPMTVYVAGTPSAQWSQFTCDADVTSNGYLIRGARIQCLLLMRAGDAEPVFTTSAQFRVEVNGGAAGPLVAEGGGATWRFNVTASTEGSVFLTSIAVVLVDGNVVVGGTETLFKLTDSAPPAWAPDTPPRVIAVTSGTVSITIDVDEPAELYVCC